MGRREEEGWGVVQGVGKPLECGEKKNRQIACRGRSEDRWRVGVNATNGTVGGVAENSLRVLQRSFCPYLGKLASSEKQVQYRVVGIPVLTHVN